MDLSIIIPIYNTPKDCLVRCLESISYINKIKYEVILVNDGSNDKNTRLYENIIKEYKSISYHYKNNTGVSDTRNTGLKYAKGKYIMFVDSDDIIFPNSITKDILLLDKDIILFNYKIITNKKNIEIKDVELDSYSEVPINYALKQFVTSNAFHSQCYKLYKNSFLKKNNIYFLTDMIHGEDAMFNLKSLYNNPSIIYIDCSMYGYYYDESNEEKRWGNKFQTIFNNYKKINNEKEYIIDNYDFDNKKVLKRIIDIDKIEFSFKSCMEISKYKNDNIKTIKEYINHIDKSVLNNIEIKYRIKYSLIKHYNRYIFLFLLNVKKCYSKIFK